MLDTILVQFPSLAAIAYTLVALALVALLGVAARYLAGRASQSKAFDLLNRAYVVVQAVVLHVEATLRPTVQKALVDGRLSPEEATFIKKEALRLVKEALADQLGQLEKTFKLGGAMDVFLSGLIEQAHAALAPSSHSMPVPVSATSTRAPMVAPFTPPKVNPMGPPTPAK